MTRILFMHQTSSIGGGSYCLLNIIKAIDRERFEPVVALLSVGPLADELRKMDVEVVIFRQMAAMPYNRGLLQRGSLKAYWDIRKSIPVLKELLKDMNIDVLYLNNMMLCSYLQSAKECGCKTVVHVREHWPLNEHKRQLEWARKCVYRYADKMIAINHYSASMFPKKEATIIYDWIDMSLRSPKISLNVFFSENVSNKKILLFTGGKSIIKGTDYVVDVFTNYIVGNDYRLLILGIDKLKELKGWKHKVKLFLEHFGYYYYDKVLQEKLKADYRIKYVPSIYELGDIINQSHCFISYFRIPHANLALAENIIMCNPCIAADTEESREYTHNGEYAKLVEMNSPEIFAKETKSFLDSIEIWRNASANGSYTIAKMFDPITNITTLNNCLIQLIR